MARTKQTMRAAGAYSGKQMRPKASLVQRAASVRVPPAGRIKKAHRWRPGTVALREIKKAQKSVEFCLLRAPFRRLVREIAQDLKENLRFTGTALEAIQEAAETHLVDYFQASVFAMANCNRVTTKPKDGQTSIRIGRILPNAP